MHRYHNIIAGYDGSSCSDKAIAEAIRIAAWSVTPLWIIRAIADDDVDAIGRATGMDAPDILRAQERRDHGALEHLDDNRPEVEWHNRCVTGEAAEIMLAQAEERKSGLIILGSHGHSHQESGALGAVARTILRSAHPDVLLVRESKVGDFARVGVVLGAGPEADRVALDRASAIAFRSGASLVALSCYPSGWVQLVTGTDEEAKALDLATEGMAAQKAELQSLIDAEAMPGDLTPPTLEIVADPTPSVAVLRLLCEEAVDLAVLSRSLSSAAPDIENIITSTPCSVLWTGER